MWIRVYCEKIYVPYPFFGISVSWWDSPQFLNIATVNHITFVERIPINRHGVEVAHHLTPYREIKSKITHEDIRHGN